MSAKVVFKAGTALLDGARFGVISLAFSDLPAEVSSRADVRMSIERAACAFSVPFAAESGFSLVEMFVDPALRAVPELIAKCGWPWLTELFTSVDSLVLSKVCVEPVMSPAAELFVAAA